MIENDVSFGQHFIVKFIVREQIIPRYISVQIDVQVSNYKVNDMLQR